MSQTDKQIEQAGEVLFDELYAPSFAKQCAARGIVIASSEELSEALNNVVRIKQAAARSASDGNGSVHKRASFALRNVLGEADEAATAKAALDEQFAKLADEVVPTAEALEAAGVMASLSQET